jgi:hypothetical protein
MMWFAWNWLGLAASGTHYIACDCRSQTTARSELYLACIHRYRRAIGSPS